MDVDFSIVLDQIGTIFDDFLRLLPGFLVGIVVFILFYYVASLIRSVVKRVLHAYGRPENLGRVLGRLSRWSFLTLGFLVSLLIVFPDFSVGQLVQILGLGSLAAGIAFCNIFEDFLAGVILLLNELFGFGDQIVVDDYEGTIEDIQTRTTSIETYDGRHVIIPNADLLTNAVVVNTAYARRRIEYDVGVGYGDDVEVARRLILEAIDGVSGILKMPAPDWNWPIPLSSCALAGGSSRPSAPVPWIPATACCKPSRPTCKPTASIFPSQHDRFFSTTRRKKWMAIGPGSGRDGRPDRVTCLAPGAWSTR